MKPKFKPGDIVLNGDISNYWYRNVIITHKKDTIYKVNCIDSNNIECIRNNIDVNGENFVLDKEYIWNKQLKELLE